jgi:hypothetical protein
LFFQGAQEGFAVSDVQFRIYLNFIVQLSESWILLWLDKLCGERLRTNYRTTSGTLAGARRSIFKQDLTLKTIAEKFEVDIKDIV